jgi:Na+-translocating ferredoxin:NAD+ oxidoreductase RnfG subunit
MKKLFEKPMFHYTFVLTVVAIVCGLMIGGMNAITDPIIQRNLEEAERKAYQEVLPAGQNFEELVLVDGVPASVQGAILGTDANGNVVGYIYTANGSNQHGSISIVISVDASGEVLGASILSINQTKGIDDTRNNLQSFVGTQIGSTNPIGDIVTGVTNSLNTIKGLLTDISVAHGLLADVPSDPYVSSFGEGYTLTDDTAFVATANITGKKIAKDASSTVVGYVYYLTGIGDYEGYDGTVTGKGIGMEVLFDENYVVLDVFIPEGQYQHTVGYRNQILTYAESFIGKSPVDFADAMLNPDNLATGVTYTRNLVNVLLNALLDEVN